MSETVRVEDETAAMERSQERSHRLYRQARELIFGGTQTLSKQPERCDAERFPVYIERGRGCRLQDIDGNEFTDFVMALGPIVLGYCHPAVDQAVREQLSRGVLFSGNSPLEVELAEKLTTLIPNAEQVRFFKTGAEAVAAAVRLARHYTHREKVVSCGYHGWHDGFVAKRGESGVPALLARTIYDLPYGDTSMAESLIRQHWEDLACVVIEPVVVEMDADFLRQVVRLARSVGAVVIFDEIITGFRVALGGIQQLLGIDADLIVFGKAVANGFPLSAVVGRRRIFDAAEDLWISSTFGGETLSLAAALVTISELERAEVIQHMWDLGECLLLGWRSMLADFPEIRAEATGISPMPVLRFGADAARQQDLFIGEMLNCGFITRRNHYWFLTSSHTRQDTDRALAATEAAFRRIRQFQAV
jgi:glutamate-1-semialdehyde aminotransferase